MYFEFVFVAHFDICGMLMESNHQMKHFALALPKIRVRQAHPCPHIWLCIANQHKTLFFIYLLT